MTNEEKQDIIEEFLIKFGEEVFSDDQDRINWLRIEVCKLIESLK